MKISRQVGQTSTILGLFITDATVSTGAGLANLIGSTINYSWIRNNQASYSTGIASTAATTGTYSTSGFTQVHSSQAKGLYHFCPPDDLFVSGDSVLLLIYGTTGAAASMAPLPIEIELTRTNNQQYASSTRFGSIGAPVGVSTYGTPFPAVGVTTVSQGVLNLIWDEPTTSHTASSSFGLTITKTASNVSTLISGVGVTSIALSGASTITQGVNATTGTLSVGLVGVSTITLSAASTITQGVNTTTGTLTLGSPVGVSTLTATAINSIWNEVTTSHTASSSFGLTITQTASNVSTVGSSSQIADAVWDEPTTSHTLSSSFSQLLRSESANVSTIVSGVNVTNMASSSFKFSTVDPGAWPLYGIIDAGIAQSTTANSIQLRSAFSATTSVLVGATVFLYGGTSDIYDRRIVTSYVSATDLAGVDAWTVVPETSPSYIVFATPPASGSLPPAVNLTQIYGSPAVTTSAGTLGVANSGLVGVSTITLSAASTITQGVNATTGTLSVGLVGVSTITLSAASTITQGVNATTGTLSVGLVGVSSITLSAASTITQGVNATTGTLSVGLVGVSSITLSAASTITQGVNATSGALNGLVGVSTLTASAFSTITQGVNVTAMSGGVQTGIADTIYTSTLPEGFRSINAPGTLAQLMYETVAHLGEFSNTGTTKIMHSVTSHVGTTATYGYDSSTTPSSITRTA